MGEYKIPNVQPMDFKARGLVKGDGIASVHSEAVHNAPNYRTKERYLKRKEHGIQRNYLYNLGQSTNGAWKIAQLGMQFSQQQSIKSMPNLVDDKRNIEQLEDINYPNLVLFTEMEPGHKELMMEKSPKEEEVKQYGAPGKSTLQAIGTFLYFVHRK
ncbi:uncharacterized protein FIESC28_00932 [Fusarium coffeatum]|uniref:Uncharacterized protein n=1 Tax=Fusarium coffeatum TaxID=231269 RepID=A0A366SAC9_9HYPO|nr:uncharacterized protein FIESC28_00932 [Fusarium coffeatum]RBR26287.1 hypothetical protein FIESC28_00932 [Fusarium coffeatum]